MAKRPIICQMVWSIHMKSIVILLGVLKITREGFLRKKHSCSSIFSKLCFTPIFLIHIFPLNEITSFLFTFIHVQTT